MHEKNITEEKRSTLKYIYLKYTPEPDAEPYSEYLKAEINKTDKELQEELNVCIEKENSQIETEKARKKQNKLITEKRQRKLYENLKKKFEGK